MIRLPVMPDESGLLPPEITSALRQLARGPRSEFHGGVARLCRQHAEHAARIWAEAEGLERRAAATDVGDARKHRAAVAAAAELGVGDRVGPFSILSVIGEGGMGTVYLAEQKEPIRRRVALKVIKLGMDSKAVLARFELERQALAVMNHDNIARVYDAGTSERGQPYFVMEHCPGLPLNEYCDRHRLPLEARLQLFQQVCHGVQHAHQKGVIHRDLKPSNVLVTEEQGKPVPKIIDFGIARSTDHALVAQTIFTEEGRIIGTPEYMAPEQADPMGADVDTRADVYSLGVMLYEVLVGTVPFSRQDLQGKGFREMQRLICLVEPQRPSTKLTTRGRQSAETAHRLRTSSGALSRILRNDLDWVVLKALEKDRNRRYDTATALAEDLQRFLDHDPLVAGPPSMAYRLRKLLRRYRVPIATSAAIILTAITGTAVAVKYAVLANDRAEQNAALAREKSALATSEQRAKNQYAAKVEEFDLLAGVVLYRRAIEREKHLYPAWPQNVTAMQEWLLDDCGRLLATRGAIEQTIENLRQRALPSSESEHRPGSDQRTYRFAAADDSARFLHDTLTVLLRDLDGLERRQKAAVEQRLRWAGQLSELTRGHPNARVTWAVARAGVAHGERYGGQQIPLRDADVLGLVPLGANPVTGLWEFYDLRSAWDGQSNPATIVIPEHRPDGSIEVRDETGIVFVLLPGGKFWMGAQATDANGRNYDPQAEPDESPVREVKLAPFFLARHELTQGQWARLWSGDESLRQPSYYQESNFVGGRVTAAHPVELVDWSMCDTLLRQHGLALPTEAQWEYGCRAGTSGPWFCALDRLLLYANVADASAKIGSPTWTCESWSDGHAIHAPVGSFAANAFGLYDMHGNVYEWCADSVGRQAASARASDGLQPQDSARDKAFRGGACNDPAVYARSSSRVDDAATFRIRFLGLRATRAARRDD